MCSEGVFPIGFRTVRGPRFAENDNERVMIISNKSGEEDWTDGSPGLPLPDQVRLFARQIQPKRELIGNDTHDEEWGTDEHYQDGAEIDDKGVPFDQAPPEKVTVQDLGGG